MSQDAVVQVERQPVIDETEFTNDDAVDLGLVAVEVVRERGLNLAVRIVLRQDVVFQAKLKNTGPGHDPWLSGKAATVTITGEPSILARLRAEALGQRFEDRADIDHEVVKAKGGSIPIRVGGELVGTITMSGETDVTDHDTAAEAVRRFLAARAQTIDTQGS